MDKIFTILIADRNRNVREFLRREFSELGFIIELAKDGIELIELISFEPPPDLLICDLEMPFFNGLETLDQLQELRPDLPIVIYTFLPEDTFEIESHKVSAFLEKTGNDVEKLKQAVLKALKEAYPDPKPSSLFDLGSAKIAEPG